MLFSVIVPVYNVEKYLVECLESILPQVVDCADGAELILVDDGSTDDSGCICDQYQKAYPDFVRVFHKSNEGLLQTRRFGFRQAKGKYIVNCDSDDLLEKTALQELAEVIQKTEADIVIYEAYSLNEDGNIQPFVKDVYSVVQFGIIEKQAILDTFLFSKHNIASMCSKCFKRTMLELEFDYSIFGKLCLGEDTMQTAEVFSRAERYVYYNRPLYYYRIGSGMMAKYSESYYSDSKQVMDHVVTFFRKYNVAVPSEYYPTKYFATVGRTITQSRLNNDMNYQHRRAYLCAIREDAVFNEQLPYFNQIREHIKLSHRIFCKLLIAKQYRLIDLLLRVKNLT